MLNEAQLILFPTDLLERISGDGAFSAHQVSPPELAGPGSLVFASTTEQMNQALARMPTILILDRKLSPPAAPPKQTQIFRTPHVGLAMAKILPLFDRKLERFGPAGERHAQTAVHSTAQIGTNVTIGAFAVIGANARVGDGCIVGSQVTIEHGARIGARSILHPQSFVGAYCEIGADCEIHPHATIGADGFSFAQDRHFTHHKLPQLGRVVLGDRVEIGANTTIDRAAFTETRIDAGSKIDNLCHVAHNCQIGENAVIAAGFMVAGSTTIGRNFMAGGVTCIGDHVVITDNVVLAGKSVVANKVEKSGVYGGYPLEPMRDHLRTVMSLPHLVGLRRQMNRVLKHLNLQEES